MHNGNMSRTLGENSRDDFLDLVKRRLDETRKTRD